jgi:hypothetical protein
LIVCHQSSGNLQLNNPLLQLVIVALAGGALCVQDHAEMFEYIAGAVILVCFCTHAAVLVLIQSMEGPQGV